MIASAVAKELGYKTILNDYLSNNVRSERAAANISRAVGSIPRAAYLVGAGWQNQVIVYNDLQGNDSIPSFTQLIKNNENARQKNTSKL